MLGNTIGQSVDQNEGQDRSVTTSSSRRQFLAGGAAAALTAVSALASARSNAPDQDSLKGIAQSTGKNPPLPGRELPPGGSKVGPPIGRGGGGTGTQVGPPIHGNPNDPFTKYWKDPALRLARRITFGVRYDEVDSIRAKGFSAYLNEQLNWQSIDDSETANYLATNFPHTGMSLDQLLLDIPTNEEVIYPFNYYCAFTNRQLHARMCEFWLDHFSILIGKAYSVNTAEYVYQRIFPNAIGNFRQLIGLIATSPAMNLYLDNQLNVKNKPNINYARELLELHTVGVNGGYTEEDINDAAKMLTGWTYQWVNTDPNYAHVYFNASWHEPGSKTVLGRTFTENGENELGDLLDYLCSLPQTHNFICNKLYRFFIGRDATSAELATCSAIWQSNNGNIDPILRSIFKQATLMTAPSMYKRPFHFFIGYWRQFDLKTALPQRLMQRYLLPGGHAPFGWNDPDGYPLAPDHWYNSHLFRLQCAMRLGCNGELDTAYDEAKLFPDQSSADTLMARLEQVLFAGELPVPEKIWIYRFVRGKTIGYRDLHNVVAVALGSPSYQWY